MRSQVQLLLGPPFLCAAVHGGALAQLGERLLCKHQVIGSIPIGSTSFQVPENVRGTFSLKTPERKRGHFSRDEDESFAGSPATGATRRIFDIVNGFFNRCRGDAVSVFGLRLDQRIVSLQIIIWLRFLTSTSRFSVCRVVIRTSLSGLGGEPSAVDGDVDSQA